MTFAEAQVSGWIDGEPKVVFLGDTRRPKLTLRLNSPKSYQDREGNWKRARRWISVEMWGEMALRVSNQYGNGDFIAVLGELTYETWKDKNTGGFREKLVVQARTVESIERRKKPRGSSDHALLDAAIRHQEHMREIERRKE